MNILRKRPVWIVLIALTLITGYASLRFPTGPASGQALHRPSTQPAPVPLRIAFFNIASGRGADGRIDLQRTITQLKGDHGASGQTGGYDFLGLAEVRGTLTGDNQARQIAAALDFSWLFCPTENTQFHDDFGNAILARFRVDSWERAPMPGTRWSHHRNVAICKTTFGQRPLTLMVTHVDRTVDRANQIAFLTSLLAQYPGQLVLMGDFNTRPDDPLLAPIRDQLTDAIYLHLKSPNPNQVDWIFTRDVRVIDAGLIDQGASDHPLAYVEIEPEPSPR